MKRCCLFVYTWFLASVIYAQPDSVKQVQGGEDYERVVLYNDYPGFYTKEVQSLDVMVSAKKVGLAKSRVREKLKMYAAMLGGNVAVILNEQSNGATYAGTPGASGRMPAYSSLRTMIMATVLPDLNEFIKKQVVKQRFKPLQKFHLIFTAIDRG